MAELPGSKLVTSNSDFSPGSTSKHLYYALYTYHANRRFSNTTNSSLTDETVSDYLQKEAKANDDFSLSVIFTSLSTEKETELRECIAQKFTKGTVYSGTGNVTMVDLGLNNDSAELTLNCYYCLLRQGPNFEISEDQPAENGFYSREYVMCFLYEQEEGLDLFRGELDKYCQALLPMLDRKNVSENQAVQSYLTNWYSRAVECISRCVHRFKEDVQYLIYGALVSAKFDIQDADDALKSDIKRFIESCSLSELLNSIPNDNKSNESSSQSDFETVMEPGIEVPIEQITLTIQGKKHKFSKTTTSQFCSEWAKMLVSGEKDGVVYLKQVNDSFKLRAIQDMNTLKRLVRQAENDHYALYRAYVFLKSNGNGSILLHHAKIEDHTVTSSESRKVLVALEDFLESSTGTVIETN